MQHFGHNVQTIRSARRWSQADLEQRTEPTIRQRRISNLENGLRPKPWEITTLAKALGVPTAALTGPALITIPDDITSDTQPAA